ncbi:MAG: MFS transporter [Phycisphaerales bacterium]|nr:MFS transporter [Phycisphaerales bacterium]
MSASTRTTGGDSISSTHDTTTAAAIDHETGGNRPAVAPFIIVSAVYVLITASYGLFGAVKDIMAPDIGISMSALLNLEMTAGFISAFSVIPAGLLISRFSPGRLAWLSTLVFCVGLGMMVFSVNMTFFSVSRVIIAVGGAIAIPLLGQVGRDTFSTRTFVMATAMVFVVGRVVQSISLTVGGLIHESVGWRVLYGVIAAMLVPLVVLAWVWVKPVRTEASRSMRSTLSMTGRLLKSPLVWLCGVATGLTLSTSSSFGFIWNINLQTALGWENLPANMLVMVFVVGLIVGGYLASWLSGRFNPMAIIFIGLSLGTVMFALILFVTPFRGQLWYAIICLFTLGSSFGTATLIMPYVAGFFAAETSAMFFGVVTSVRGVVRSLLIGAPLWHLSKDQDWTAPHVLIALIPYLGSFVVGIMMLVVIAILVAHHRPRESSG